MAAFSFCHWALSLSRSAWTLASSFSSSASRSLEAASFSFFSASRSMASWVTRRSSVLEFLGMIRFRCAISRGLVHEVDGLVGQEAVGDVAVREDGGGDERGVLDAHAVVDLNFSLRPRRMEMVSSTLGSST
jgi:hypothetical protein